VCSRLGTMIGRTLLHYTITEQIGEGGMGVVYKARDRRLNRMVVVKTLRPDKVEDAEKKKRFMQEAQAASALNHPNIVTIHDIATVDNIEFIVMELVQGRALDCIIPDSGLDVETALKYGIQIASALEAAHDSGIVHRDLKPGNVMVTTNELVKLLDFGLAKLTEKPKQAVDVTTTVHDRVPSTADGALVGTIAYMSPEQALADVLDGRSDLFSFGAVLYEMLTGQRAFRGASAIATLCGVLREDPPRPSSVNSQVPPPLDALVMRCLEKRPEDRYKTALEVKSQLEDILRREAAKPQTPAVAILPFSNLSGDAKIDGLCHALAKDIAGALTRVPSLRVTVPDAASLPAVRPLHGPAIGQQLRADLVLDGNVRTAGNRLRITTELVSVADGYHLWSERYERDAGEVFTMLDDICRDIVTRVRKHLSAAKPANTTELDRCYIEGRAHLEQFTAEGLAKAKECFEKAVMSQRNSAPTYAAVAEYYAAAAILGIRRGNDAMPKAEWAARKAISIDANAERAHACVGVVLGMFEHSWDEAAESFRYALQINGASPPVRQAHALWHLAPLGRMPEAVENLQIAVHGEPRSARRLAALGYVQCLNRDLDQAERSCRGALEADETYWLAHWAMGWVLLAARQNKQALVHATSAMTQSIASAWAMALHAIANAAAGDPNPASRAIAEMETEGRAARSLAWAALIRAAMGDADQAFRGAARAVQERDPIAPFVLRNPVFDAYRSDARYNAIIRRMRIAAGQPA
jgi:serine/threonine protein kinase/Tfp pilus assembly protein PilF